MSRRGRGRNGPRQPGGGRQESGPRHRARKSDRTTDRRSDSKSGRSKPHKFGRRPEARAAKAVSLEGPRPVPSSFEARKARAPQDDGPKAAPQFSASVQNITVTSDENNMRVDRFFEARFPGLSFSHIQRIIRKGEVRVNGK